MRFIYKVFDNKTGSTGYSLFPTRWVVEKEFFKPIDIEYVKNFVNSAKDDLDQLFELFETPKEDLKKSSSNEECKLIEKTEPTFKTQETSVPGSNKEDELLQLKNDIAEIKSLLTKLLGDKQILKD
jgi:hypothetical protein